MLPLLMPDYPSNPSPSRDWPKDEHRFRNALMIFLGFNPKGSSHSEGTKSPTFPLDINTSSEAGSSDWHVNSLDSQLSSPNGQSETIPIGSPHAFANPSFQTGMEHSESYTCVTSHAPKSTTKHIYTHCGMECETVQYPVREQLEHGLWDAAPPPRSYSNVPVSHFLRACYLCKRQLNHGKDIYMYRGDKAFCSIECRYQYILMDEQMETFSSSPQSSRSATSDGGKFFLSSKAAASYDQRHENCPLCTVLL